MRQRLLCALRRRPPMIYITTYPLTQRINPMRKLLLTTAAVAAAIGLAGCGNSDSDTLTDCRDGQKYRTVKIGEQTWMAQNLNYKTDSSWCYNDSLSYCKKYGRLYAWNAAMKACPAGYHLPSDDEWENLAQTVETPESNYDAFLWERASEKLKAKCCWNDDARYDANRTDDFGFSAQPGGFRNPHYHNGIGLFNEADRAGFWWTATYHDGVLRVLMDRYDSAIWRRMGDESEFEAVLYPPFSPNMNYGFSVRCVADRP
jgi:uncharacterized protein (TIGR02145 family)